MSEKKCTDNVDNKSDSDEFNYVKVSLLVVSVVVLILILRDFDRLYPTLMSAIIVAIIWLLGVVLDGRYTILKEYENNKKSSSIDCINDYLKSYGINGWRALLLRGVLPIFVKKELALWKLRQEKIRDVDNDKIIVFEYLIKIAKEGKTTSLSDIVNSCFYDEWSYFKYSNYIRLRLLDPIGDLCYAQQANIITCLVVCDDCRDPGDGFYQSKWALPIDDQSLRTKKHEYQESCRQQDNIQKYETILETLKAEYANKKK